MGKKKEGPFSAGRQNRKGLGAWRLMWVLSSRHVECVTYRDEVTSLPLVLSNTSSNKW